MGDEEDEHDSPVEGQPEKVKKPKKVYCYISPKVPEERGEEPEIGRASCRERV